MVMLFNMGLPMIMPAVYFMIIALIPIVLIESLSVSRSLSIRFSRTALPITLANVLSTLIGIPITWGLLFAIQIAIGNPVRYDSGGIVDTILSVTLNAPWLAPFGENEYWVFYAAALFLLGPFFFATWLVEYVVTRNKLAVEVTRNEHEVDTRTGERMVLRAIRNANLRSYGLIALLLVSSFIVRRILSS